MKTVKRLKRFRHQCERSTGQPAGEIELSLLHVLSDICKGLGIGKADRRRVLGRKGVQHLSDYQKWQVGLKK